MLSEDMWRTEALVNSSLSVPGLFMPTAAGRPDSSVCYDLEEVMYERARSVLSF